ncbi:glycine, alanine and asparagine-rich protein-like [Gossypium australe]|uniref:Glycine, alanine and asparagine-rich protein-like n=1 Tax=Gossypium australe TaxID=47621 RepID=A0A5B6VF34_9ROSI|nr:glycine, alanine and asparagine-rich protein-like [Gossypium australe]
MENRVDTQYLSRRDCSKNITDSPRRNKLRGQLGLEGRTVCAYKLLYDSTLDPSTNYGAYNFLQKSQLQYGISPGITYPRLLILRAEGDEDYSHIFRQCPTSIKVWQLLDLSWVTGNIIVDFWEWLTWVFMQGAEQDGARAKQKLLDMARIHRCKEILLKVKMHFDAAFDKRNSRSVSGVVVWGPMDEFLASKMILHNNVPSPFAAEAYIGLEAIKLGISIGIWEIQVKGDSRTVIRKCQTTEKDKFAIGAIIQDIQNMSALFRKIDFKHIHRIENMRAHQIAKEALESGVTSYLVQEDSNLQDLALEGRWARRPD